MTEQRPKRKKIADTTKVEVLTRYYAGESIASLCKEYGIYDSQLFSWRIHPKFLYLQPKGWARAGKKTKVEELIEQLAQALLEEAAEKLLNDIRDGQYYLSKGHKKPIRDD